MSWSPWPSRRNRFALRQKDYGAMEGQRLEDFLHYLDTVIHDPDRVEAAETFLARKRVDQARRVVQMAKELLHTEHAELNILTGAEQVTVVGADDDGAYADRRSHQGTFCQNVVALADTLSIEDAKRHVLVMNTEVIESGVALSYLGAPIQVQGHSVGALCVYDSKVRQWSDADVARLEQLAGVVSDSVPSPPRPLT